MAVFPAKFEGVVSYGTDLAELRLRNRDEFFRFTGPMSLAEGAGTITAKVFLWVLPNVAVIPGDPDYFLGPDMVHLDWSWPGHWDLSLKQS